MQSLETSSIVCYQCRKDDAMQNVPAVMAGGTAQGDFSGPSGSVTFIDGKTGYSSGYSHLSGTMTSNLARMLTPPTEPPTTSFGWYFGQWVLGYFSLCLIITPYFWWKAYSKELYRRTTDYPRRLQIWQNGIRRWRGLYYCHRCGIVCDPSTHTWMSPEYMVDQVFSYNANIEIQQKIPQSANYDSASKNQIPSRVENPDSNISISLFTNTSSDKDSNSKETETISVPKEVSPLGPAIKYINETATEHKISLGLENLFQEENELPENKLDQLSVSKNSWKEIAP